MYNSLHRRDFLKTTAMVSVGSLALRARGADEPGPQAAASGARLLPGCCAYSYGSYLGKGKMTMEEFIVKAGGTGRLGRGHHDVLAEIDRPGLSGRPAQLRLQARHAFFRSGDWRRPVPAGRREAEGDDREREEMGGRDGIARGLPTCACSATASARGPPRSKGFNGWSRR